MQFAIMAVIYILINSEQAFLSSVPIILTTFCLVGNCLLTRVTYYLAVVSLHSLMISDTGNFSICPISHLYGLFLRKMCSFPSIVHIFNPSIQEAKAGDL